MQRGKKNKTISAQTTTALIVCLILTSNQHPAFTQLEKQTNKKKTTHIFFLSQRWESYNAWWNIITKLFKRWPNKQYMFKKDTQSKTQGRVRFAGLLGVWIIKMSVGSWSKHDTRGGGQYSINEQLTVDIFLMQVSTLIRILCIIKKNKPTPLWQNLQFYLSWQQTVETMLYFVLGGGQTLRTTDADYSLLQGLFKLLNIKECLCFLSCDMLPKSCAILALQLWKRVPLYSLILRQNSSHCYCEMQHSTIDNRLYPKTLWPPPQTLIGKYEGCKSSF